ncbi:uncharacterized protein CTHT_0014430 [Thermochaetoides thermophila DSM 1495]|uniref:Thioredoxin-like protein n=1 Tax=Chaetomium thermophilum (strain DSM 1495 / CBS 144.50 / IMI 039719) TaxID=759272 RepID=G0S1Q4_CHATD|nr:hypothetical protein CTHT_0014430 [Thermochaetoides thermophila DSM 1495]EGS22964.1 hypothetical protein CTHT_0014430 [Thermochaetoides thermophila DSM 1495]
MFRFHKPLDVITLFHKASSPTSVRLAAVLQQRSAAATEASTEDKPGRPEFKLEITENPPTPEQLQTILEYAGSKRISTIVRGATNQAEALRKFKESPDNFIRPVVVDWNNGQARAGENESEILKMLDSVRN